MMEKELQKIWLNEKEVKVFLYLISFWISSASEIAKRLDFPKSSVNFLADNLWKSGFLRKSFRWKVGFYEADIQVLQEKLEEEILSKKYFIEEFIPQLKEKNKNAISKPKISFFDWVDSCKKAYLEILKVKEIFYEFGSHKDLIDAFWEEFMNEFISKRVEKNIFCDSIWNSWIIEENLQKLDNNQKRSLKIFSSEFWEISSSIAIFENKVLILNLKWIFSWVLIENSNLAETIKTIFRICKRN